MGPDSICPKLLINADSGLKSWLRGFLSSYLRQLKIPKIWRRALIAAIPKSSNSVEDPQSYGLIFLVCVPYKVLKRLIYNRVELTVALCSQRNRLDFDAESLPGRFANAKH